MERSLGEPWTESTPVSPCPVPISSKTSRGFFLCGPFSSGEILIYVGTEVHTRWHYGPFLVSGVSVATSTHPSFLPYLVYGLVLPRRSLPVTP